ncbi:hypothetical protein LO80_01910 [Candidatus Francisella endociliophora]|uniref:Lipoprotein n=1 Tax=Candidatus Francisella endociliophora TaxID=653937 RepID=A0A097EMQ5_9GAMM|nr:hypothetical protein [Francisella sp. FSC1006]AIT08854.1 hypothetical protein LO80_01910 [Francisella sp. FSC1006]
MRFIKIAILFVFMVSLISCGAYQYTTAKRESNEATTEQQQKVKTEILKLLEDEYKQPFKLKDFNYTYERHWVDNTCQMSFCKMEKYGIYSFKVQAVDNPIIIMNFKINDGDVTKASIKPLIDAFKKHQLNTIYCSSFGNYWKEHKNDKNNDALEKIKEYCDEKGQTESYDNFWTQ